MSDDPEDQGGLLHVWEKISLDLGGIHDSLKKREASWIQRASDTARDYPIRGSANMPASGTESLSIPLAAPYGNSPQPGRVWVLRRLAIGPSLANTSSQTASSVLLFQSPSDPLNTTALTTAELVDTFGTTNPVVHFYSSRQVVVRADDALWVVILGGAANNGWVASGQIEEYADGGYQANVEL